MAHRTPPNLVLAFGSAVLLVSAAGRDCPAAAPPDAAPAERASKPSAPPLKPADPAAAPPSLTEIGADLDAGRHDAVLRKVRAALELKGPEAKNYDRSALLRARAEALLRTKQADAAARAFEDSAWAAEDRAARAEGLATALLVRRANAGLLYVSRRPDPQDKTRTLPPTDVVQPESRKQALAALFAEELDAHRRRIGAAAAGTSLKEALDLMPALHALVALEQTATGGTATVADLATGIDARIGIHLDDLSTSLKREVEGHAAHALAAVPAGTSYKMRGLGGRAGRVAEIARQADGMRAVCVGCEDLFPESDRDFPGLRKRIERTRDLARDLLGRNYDEAYARAWATPYDQQPPRQPRDPGAGPGQVPPGQQPPMGRRLPRGPAR